MFSFGNNKTVKSVILDALQLDLTFLFTMLHNGDPLLSGAGVVERVGTTGLTRPLAFLPVQR
jgi:hypothetical protein